MSALTPKAHPISYLPLITKRYGILVFCVLFFFLEYSKNERLYLGELQRDRACVLRRDGAARARVGSPWACRGHRQGLGTRGHWRFWGEAQARVTAAPSAAAPGSRAQTRRSSPSFEEKPVPTAGLPRVEPVIPVSSIARPQEFYTVVGKRLEPGFAVAACVQYKGNGLRNPNKLRFSKYPGFLNPV